MKVCWSAKPSKKKTMKPRMIVSTVNTEMRKTMCMFCKKVLVSSKLARHFYLQHASEPKLRKVRELFALGMKKNKSEKKSEDKDGESEEPDHYTAERKQRNASLREEMKFFHRRCLLLYNSQVLGGALEEKFVPGRRTKYALPSDLYKQCPDCGLATLAKNLARHTRRDCPVKKHVGSLEEKVKKRRNVVAEADMLMPLTCKMSKKFKKEIIKGMRPGLLHTIIIRDPLIIKRGERLWKNHQHHEHRVNYIRGKLRDMARFFNQVSNDQSKITKMEQLIDPALYENLVDAAENVCGKTEDGYFERPSLALKLGYELKRYAQLLLRELLTSSNNCEKQYELVKRFLKVMEFWREDVSHFARRTLEHARNKKPIALPVAQDLQKLHKYLFEMKKEALKGLECDDEDFNQYYHLLAKVLMCQIILFNCKRAFEIHSIKLETFIQMDVELGQSVKHLLDKNEQELAENMTLLKTLGKNDKLVPVLLTNSHVKGLKTLVRARHRAVPAENVYLFANGSVDKFHNVSRALRKFAFEAKVDNPSTITSRSLRKHLATMSQLLNLSIEDRQGLSKFLSHSSGTHDKYYKLPLDAVTLARTSKILYAVNQNPDSYRGLSLGDIIETNLDKVSEMEELPEDEDEDSSPDPCSTFDSTLQANNEIQADDSRWETEFSYISDSDSYSETPRESSKQQQKQKSGKQRKPKEREHWTSEQVRFVKKHFRKQFNDRETISLFMMKAVIRENPVLFHGRSADQMRHLVNNIKRKL